MTLVGDNAGDDPPGVSAVAETELAAARLAPLRVMGQSGAYDPPYKILDLHFDHLGSTRVVTDDTGAVVSTHKYFPFGEEVEPMLGYSTKQFTGHERDRETGLDYMLARYYGASVGRFLTPDPISSSVKYRIVDTWNRYTYVLNTPENAVDPDGLDTYFLNRVIGGDSPLRSSEKFSHQVIVITDFDRNGNEFVATTIGWAQGGDETWGDNWVVNAPDDLHAARWALAIDGDDGVPGRWLERRGGKDLDGHIYKALRQRDNRSEHPSNKRKWRFWNTCRDEAQRLEREAKSEQSQEQESKQDKEQTDKEYVDPYWWVTPSIFD